MRFLFVLAILALLTADAEAGIFRHRGRSCPAGGCSAPCAQLAQPTQSAGAAPNAEAAKVEAAPLTVTGSPCVGGQCSATATKRGLFGRR